MQYIIQIVTVDFSIIDTQTIEVFSCRDEAREFIHDTCRSFFAVDFCSNPEDLQEAVEKLGIATFTITEKTITIHGA